MNIKWFTLGLSMGTLLTLGIAYMYIAVRQLGLGTVVTS